MLTGPNGSGKSSLLRIAAGFATPSAGSLTLDSIEIRADPHSYRSKIDFVGVLDCIKPALLVSETLSFWAALGEADSVPRRTAASRGLAIEAALEAVGLSGFAGQPCRRLSWGQRRRLSLARLAVLPRRLWLLDEPANGLDAEAGLLLRQLIERHRSSGGMVVAASHQELGIDGAHTLNLTDFPPSPDFAGDLADAAW